MIEKSLIREEPERARHHLKSFTFGKAENYRIAKEIEDGFVIDKSKKRLWEYNNKK